MFLFIACYSENRSRTENFVRQEYGCVRAYRMVQQQEYLECKAILEFEICFLSR